VHSIAAVVEGSRLKRLAQFAIQSCGPGLMGAVVCLLAVLLATPLGFSTFLGPLRPGSVSDFFAPALASESTFANGVRTRLAFGLSAIVLLMTSLGVALVTRAVVGAVLRNGWDDLRRSVLLLTFGGATVLFVVVLFVQTGQPQDDLLSFLFVRGGVAPGRFVQALVDVLNALTSVVTVWLAVAFSMLSAPVKADDRALGEFANRLRMLQVLLFLGAACLVSRVVQVYCLYAWPVTQLGEPAAAESIAVSVSAGVGTIYSIFLASVYLPAAAALSSRLRELRVEESERVFPPPAAQGRPAMTVDQVLALHGATGGSFKELGRVLAVLSPLLVGLLQGPVLAVLEKVAGGGHP
jgi:hypothetical protein